MTERNKKDLTVKNEDEEFLTRVVVDTCSRTFRLYSNEGDEKVIECDTTEEFMNILELVRGVADDDIVFYSEMSIMDS
tara:strand:+ start:138 stop:371 length:234 start_codon:yes stop_codon:yes gene_type:complete